jgi:hypothetical protein
MRIESVALIISLITGICVAVIAYGQYRIEKDKVKLELYRKRYDIYIKVQEFIAIIVGNTYCKTENLQMFLRDTREVEFLFNQDIVNYLDEMYKKGVAMRDTYNLETRDPDSFYEIQDWLDTNLRNLLKNLNHILILHNYKS